MFEFKASLNEDDYIAFNQYHLLNSPLGKRNLLNFRLIIPLICFMFVVIFFITDADLLIIFIEAILMTLISILWIVFSKKIFLKSMKKNIGKMKKEGRLPYHSESTLKFDEEHLYVITPDMEIKSKYSMIEKIILAEKVIYIYVGSVQAYVLPLTAFSGETQKQEFLNFINTKIEGISNAK